MALCFCFSCAFSNSGAAGSARRPFGYANKQISLSTTYLCRKAARQTTTFQMKTTENKVTQKTLSTEQEVGSVESEEETLQQQQETTRSVIPSRRYGATIDMDGKSNVWAVEPKVTVQSEDETKKGNWIPLIIGLLVALIAAGLPFLPLTNADQF